MPAQEISQGRDQRYPISRRGFASGLALGIGGLVTGKINVATAVEQCSGIGPDVPCPTPDGIARRAFAEVNRTVVNNNQDYAISNAGVRLYVIKPVGTSDHPELDRQNPILGPDGLPIAFVNTKNGQVREVEKTVVFKAAEPGDPRFNGKLINTSNGQDHIEIKRNGDEVKDRALGKIRDASGCEVDCGLNCVETVVWERLKSGTDLRPFTDSKGREERFQAAVWSFNYEETADRKVLVSHTEISDAELRRLLTSGEVALMTGPSPREVSVQHQMEVSK